MLPALIALAVLQAAKMGSDIVQGQQADADSADAQRYNIAQNEKISRMNRRNAIGRTIGAISPMPQKWEAPPSPRDKSLARIIGGVADVGSRFVGGMDAGVPELQQPVGDLYNSDVYNA